MTTSGSVGLGRGPDAAQQETQYTINPQGTSDKNKAQLDRGFYQTILAWVKGIAANPGGTNAYEQSQSAALANFSQPILAAPQNYGQPATYLNQPEQTRQPQQPQQLPPQQPEQAPALAEPQTQPGSSRADVDMSLYPDTLPPDATVTPDTLPDETLTQPGTASV